MWSVNVVWFCIHLYSCKFECVNVWSLFDFAWGDAACDRVVRLALYGGGGGDRQAFTFILSPLSPPSVEMNEEQTNSIVIIRQQWQTDIVCAPKLELSPGGGRD